jgi:peptidoglycan/LPS O-acetylase OafA/YrhL
LFVDDVTLRAIHKTLNRIATKWRKGRANCKKAAAMRTASGRSWWRKRRKSAAGCYDSAMTNAFKPFYAKPGRDNNFDILRVLAASLVIWGHGWELTKTLGEPVIALSGAALAGAPLGVWIFFFISGYLVSESFQARSLLAFVEARFLRIYPAFLVSLIFGVLIGACVTTLPIAEYLGHEQTWRYIYRSLLTDIQFNLPGVFAMLPFPNGINGALWTIPIEMMMYVGVMIAGVLTLLRRPTIALLVMSLLMIALAIEPSRVLLIPKITAVYALPAVFCFAFGMIFYTNRERIPLHGMVVVLLIGAIILTGRAHPPGNIFVCAAIAYSTAWFAFHPRLRVKIPARIGDISYGLYVYAFPIQQTVIYIYSGIGPWTLFAVAFPITAMVAWISWHVIEKRALALKGALISARLRPVKI